MDNANVETHHFVILVVLVVLVIFGSYYMVANFKQSDQNTIVEKVEIPEKTFVDETGNEIEEQVEEEGTAVGDVILSGDINGCSKFDADDREFCEYYIEECVDNQCFYDHAGFYRDATLCESITDSSLKSECLNELSLDMALNDAVVNKTISPCESLDSQYETFCKDRYYFFAKVDDGDESACAKIVDDDLRLECEES